MAQTYKMREKKIKNEQKLSEKEQYITASYEE